MARRIEVTCAALAAAAGIVAIAVALFAPTIRTEAVTSDGIITRETRSMAAEGVEAGVVLVFGLAAVLLASLVAAGLLHARYGVLGSSAPLWVPAIMLAVLVVLTGFSVGLFFAPSALLALAAATAATRASASGRGHETDAEVGH